MLGPPIMVVGVFLALTRRNLAFVEVLSPAMFISFISMIVIVNKTSLICDEVTAGMRAQQCLILMLVYVNFALFMGVSWL